MLFWFIREMTFETLLTKWNKGISTGAQTSFASVLGVRQSAVSRWVTGAAVPSEEMRPQIAKLLGVPVDKLMESFAASRRMREIDEYGNFTPAVRRREARDSNSGEYLIAKLTALKKAFGAKLITEDEYNQKRKHLLERF